MTSASAASFGTDGHPEVTEISALTEGLLPLERSTEVRAHLSACTLCTDVRISLEEIRDALGTLPGPSRMPSDVASRIDAALAAEVLLDASSDTVRATSPSASPAEGPPVVSRETTPGSDRVSRETLPPARPAGHPRKATGPGRSTRRPRRWRSVLLSAGAAAVLGALVLPGLGSGSFGSADHGSIASDAADRSKSAVSGDALGARVRSLLATSEQAGPMQESEPDAPGITPKASPNTPLRAGTPAVPSCISEGIGRDEAPLAVSREPYEGRQTYIVVLPHGTDNTRVDAYVVDADCVGQTSPDPGAVLINGTFPRH